MSEAITTPFETAPRSHPRASAILLCGILGVTIVPVLGPVAWALGRSALREIDAAPGRYTRRSTVLAGMVLGIVATVFLIAGLVLVVTIIIWATTGDGVKRNDLEAVVVVVSSMQAR